MLDRFVLVLGQVVTLFLLMGVGFVLTRLKLLTEVGTKEMSRLLINVVTPCVILCAFPRRADPATLAVLGKMTVGLAACYLLYALLAQLLFRGAPREKRQVMRFGCVYGNVGFMGIPLIQAVLGDGTMLAAAVTIGVFQVMAFTHGASVMGGREALSVKKAFLNPGVLGLAMALPLFLLGISLPGPVERAVGALKELNTPLAMVVIGAQLARADLGAVLGDARLYAAAAGKLLAVPALTAAVLLPLGLPAELYTALIILSATPSAGYTSMFAEGYGRDVGVAAQLVSLSHLLSIFTLPLVVVLAQAIA